MEGVSAYQVQFGSQLDTLFRERAVLRATNSPPHAFKITTNYELPIGRGQKFGSNMNPWLDGVVGHWQVNLTGRVGQEHRDAKENPRSG